MSFYSNGLRTCVYDGKPCPGWSSKNYINDHVSLEFDYDTHKFPLIIDPVMVEKDIRWVAPMITKSGPLMVQVLNVAPVGKITGGSFLPNSLVGRTALLITPTRTKEVVVNSNTANLIFFNGAGVAEGSLILAPQEPFAMLPLLKLEQGPAGLEWRNWTNDMHGGMHSYHGNPLGDIITDAWVPLDFAPYVSPLATGVIGSLQAFASVPTANGCYISIGRDSSNHVHAQAGLDRVYKVGDGTLANFRTAFGIEKKLWAKVTPGAVGRVTIMGWIE